MSTLCSVCVLYVDLGLCNNTVFINWASSMCCMFIALFIKQFQEPFPGKLLRKNRRHISNLHSCVLLLWHSLVQELFGFTFWWQNLCCLAFCVSKLEVLCCLQLCARLAFIPVKYTCHFHFIFVSQALKKTHPISALVSAFSGSCFPGFTVRPLESDLQGCLLLMIQYA